MAGGSDKPRIGEHVVYHDAALDAEIKGTVTVLLDKQFTILVHSINGGKYIPPYGKNRYTQFIFYNSDWKLTEQSLLERRSALQ